MTKFSKDFIQKKKDFEAREVFKSKKLKSQMNPTGYEAYRVSPRTTTKFGTKYKKIYGASISPDYQRPQKKKHTYGARVNWFRHGFTSAKAKSGTVMLQPLRHYPVNQQEARMKLMLKKGKKK